MMRIIQRRKIWFAFSGLLTLISIVSYMNWGLKLGIDFTGGTLMEFGFTGEKLTSQEIKDSLKDLGLGDINPQFSGENDVLLKLKDVNEDTHQKIKDSLNAAISKKTGSNETGAENKTDEIISEEIKAEEVKTEENKSEEKDAPIKEEIRPVEIENIESQADTNSPQLSEGAGTENNAEAAAPDVGKKLENSSGNNSDIKVETTDGNDVEVKTDSESDPEAKAGIIEKKFDYIGSMLGRELQQSSIYAIVISLIAIVLYIGWAFRKVSYPVSSYKYGIAAVIALFHDIIITVGCFSILGHFYNIEVGGFFIAALLAILGYSVNDTIVVFDRTRENLLRSGMDNFEEIVNKSVNETFIRSINSSYTTLLALFALYLFGGESIKYFILALLVGITFGTYSSIFVASPIVVSWHKWSRRKG